jgi:hypothetical protein
VRLLAEPGFDVAADLEAIAGLAAAWRSMFRPAEITYTPGHFTALVEELERADEHRLYLVLRPRKPIPLAIIPGLSRDEALMVMSLANLEQGGEVVRPHLESRAQRTGRLAGQPEEGTAQAVHSFLLGEPSGMAMLDLEDAGLVLALARWGSRNILDPEPLLAQRLHRLGELLKRQGEPDREPGQEP